jgi:hypothetical protein
MTLEELEIFIEKTVQHQLQRFTLVPDSRTLDEIFDSIEEHRWTPPVGAKSPLDLLREDRDS